MRSLGGSRSVLALAGKTVLGVLLVALAPVMLLWPFGRTHAPHVEVHDEVGILQAPAVEERLSTLRFRDDVDLVVLTLDADYNANFNLEVLTYAREHQTQWISAEDPNYWADGLVILAVSPSGRWVGTYFGEDVKVGTSVQESIQEAGKDAFRESNWAGGIANMGQEAASVIGKPGIAGASWLWVSGALVGLGGTVSLWWAGLTSRRRFRQATRHYANVTRDWDETEVLARTIPEDEPHGAQVLMRYSWFRGRYFGLTKKMQEAGTRKWADWFRFRNVEYSRSLLKEARTLDSLDDTIANASALLTMSSRWREAWDNELGPVYEDAAALESLCAKVDATTVCSSAADDREWLRTTVAGLGQLTADLDARRVTPSAAMDRLDSVSGQIRERALALARAAIREDSSSHASGRVQQYSRASKEWRRSSNPYSGSWTMGGMRGSYHPASTVRLNSSSAGLAGAGSSARSAATGYAPLSGLVTGYSRAAHWSPPSSSSGGSSSGYGGGGFSGAGSSSHF